MNNELTFEDPIQIPLVVRHVLVMPFKVAGIRVQRDRAVRVQRFTADAFLLNGMHKRTRVVRGSDAVVDVGLAIEEAGQGHLDTFLTKSG